MSTAVPAVKAMYRTLDSNPKQTLSTSKCCTCEVLQKVVEHVGNSQHHLWKQPGGGHFCGCVLHCLYSNGGACEVMLDDAACRMDTHYVTSLFKTVFGY